VGEMRQVPSTGERALRVTAIAFAVTVCAFVHTGAANAIGLPSSFTMSPSSGPVGTTVNVSGTGCTGTLSKSVAVTATTVPTTVIHPSVASNGSWSGSFSIPSSTPAAPVAVAPVCVSDGLSLAYTPQTFTVTGAIVTPPTVPPVTVPPATVPPVLPGVTVPTLPPLPEVTLPGGTTATTQPSNPSDPSDPGGPGTTSPVSLPNDRIDDGRGGSGGGGNGSSDIGDGIHSGAGGQGGSGSATAGGASGKGGKSAEARAAELSSPELAAAKGDKGGGLAWLLWLLALSVPIGGVALYVWMRRTRRANIPELETDPS
jgi:hypothetical protein